MSLEANADPAPVYEVVDGEKASDVQIANGSDVASREKLISTAVKFLQNRVVSSSSLKEKQEFLSKKGLTDAEINEALVRAQQELNSLQHVPAGVKARNRFKDWSLFFVAFGGAFYGCYRFYKEFVVPFLSDQKSESETVVERLTQNTEALSSFGTRIDQLQKSCEENSQKIDQLRTAASSADSREIKDLKDEFSSLKKLLLNRHQFPQAPVIKPFIPQWQLEESGQSTNSNNSTPLSSAVKTDNSELHPSSPPGSQASPGGGQPEQNGLSDSESFSDQEDTTTVRPIKIPSESELSFNAARSEDGDTDSGTYEPLQAYITPTPPIGIASRLLNNLYQHSLSLHSALFSSATSDLDHDNSTERIAVTTQASLATQPFVTVSTTLTHHEPSENATGQVGRISDSRSFPPTQPLHFPSRCLRSLPWREDDRYSGPDVGQVTEHVNVSNLQSFISASSYHQRTRGVHQTHSMSYHSIGSYFSRSSNQSVYGFRNRFYSGMSSLYASALGYRSTPSFHSVECVSPSSYPSVAECPSESVETGTVNHSRSYSETFTNIFQQLRGYVSFNDGKNLESRDANLNDRLICDLDSCKSNVEDTLAEGAASDVFIEDDEASFMWGNELTHTATCSVMLGKTSKKPFDEAISTDEDTYVEDLCGLEKKVTSLSTRQDFSGSHWHGSQNQIPDLREMNFNQLQQENMHSFSQVKPLENPVEHKNRHVSGQSQVNEKCIGTCLIGFTNSSTQMETTTKSDKSMQSSHFITPSNTSAGSETKYVVQTDKSSSTMMADKFSSQKAKCVGTCPVKLLSSATQMENVTNDQSSQFSHSVAIHKGVRNDMAQTDKVKSQSTLTTNVFLGLKTKCSSTQCLVARESTETQWVYSENMTSRGIQCETVKLRTHGNSITGIGCYTQAGSAVVSSSSQTNRTNASVELKNKIVQVTEIRSSKKNVGIQSSMYSAKHAFILDSIGVLDFRHFCGKIDQPLVCHAKQTVKSKRNFAKCKQLTQQVYQNFGHDCFGKSCGVNNCAVNTQHISLGSDKNKKSSLSISVNGGVNIRPLHNSSISIASTQTNPGQSSATSLSSLKYDVIVFDCLVDLRDVQHIPCARKCTIKPCLHETNFQTSAVKRMHILGKTANLHESLSICELDTILNAPTELSKCFKFLPVVSTVENIILIDETLFKKTVFTNPTLQKPQFDSRKTNNAKNIRTVSRSVQTHAVHTISSGIDKSYQTKEITKMHVKSIHKQRSVSIQVRPNQLNLKPHVTKVTTEKYVKILPHTDFPIDLKKGGIEVSRIPNTHVSVQTVSVKMRSKRSGGGKIYLGKANSGNSADSMIQTNFKGHDQATEMEELKIFGILPTVSNREGFSQTYPKTVAAVVRASTNHASQQTNELCLWSVNKKVQVMTDLQDVSTSVDRNKECTRGSQTSPQSNNGPKLAPNESSIDKAEQTPCSEVSNKNIQAVAHFRHAQTLANCPRLCTWKQQKNKSLQTDKNLVWRDAAIVSTNESSQQTNRPVSANRGIGAITDMQNVSTMCCDRIVRSEKICANQLLQTDRGALSVNKVSQTDCVLIHNPSHVSDDARLLLVGSNCDRKCIIIKCPLVDKSVGSKSNSMRDQSVQSCTSSAANQLTQVDDRDLKSSCLGSITSESGTTSVQQEVCSVVSCATKMTCTECMLCHNCSTMTDLPISIVCTNDGEPERDLIPSEKSVYFDVAGDLSNFIDGDIPSNKFFSEGQQSVYSKVAEGFRGIDIATSTASYPCLLQLGKDCRQSTSRDCEDTEDNGCQTNIHIPPRRFLNRMAADTLLHVYTMKSKFTMTTTKAETHIGTNTFISTSNEGTGTIERKYDDHGTEMNISQVNNGQQTPNIAVANKGQLATIETFDSGIQSELVDDDKNEQLKRDQEKESRMRSFIMDSIKAAQKPICKPEMRSKSTSFHSVSDVDLAKKSSVNDIGRRAFSSNVINPKLTANQRSPLANFLTNISPSSLTKANIWHSSSDSVLWGNTLPKEFSHIVATTQFANPGKVNSLYTHNQEFHSAHDVVNTQIVTLSHCTQTDPWVGVQDSERDIEDSEKVMDRNIAWEILESAGNVMKAKEKESRNKMILHSIEEEPELMETPSNTSKHSGSPNSRMQLFFSKDSFKPTQSKSGQALPVLERPAMVTFRSISEGNLDIMASPEMLSSVLDVNTSKGSKEVEDVSYISSKLSDFPTITADDFEVHRLKFKDLSSHAVPYGDKKLNGNRSKEIKHSTSDQQADPSSDVDISDLLSSEMTNCCVQSNVFERNSSLSVKSSTEDTLSGLTDILQSSYSCSTTITIDSLNSVLTAPVSSVSSNESTFT